LDKAIEENTSKWGKLRLDPSKSAEMTICHLKPRG
jgi:hypothetical protein